VYIDHYRLNKGAERDVLDLLIFQPFSVDLLALQYRDSVSTPKWLATFFSNHLRFIPLERSLSCRSLGSSHGVAPQERLFVIDVAFTFSSPRN